MTYVIIRIVIVFMFAKPTQVASAHTWCAGLVTLFLSWNRLCACELAQRPAVGIGICVFQLPVAECIEKGALSLQAAFLAQAHTVTVVVGGALPWSVLVRLCHSCTYDISHLYCVDDVDILHLSYVYLISIILCLFYLTS